MSSPPSQPPPPPPHRLSNIMGTPVFDIDLSGETDSNDLPFWLRDVIDRVFSATGIANPSRKQSASDDAIESLVEVKDERLRNDRCPICFDDYDMTNEGDSKTSADATGATGQFKMSEKYRQAHSLNKKLTNYLHECGIGNIQSLENGRRFRDPAMFFPADTSGSIPFRFPSSSLYTLEPIADDDLFPTYTEDSTRRSRDATKEKQVDEESHVPVKMPSCDHVFGRSCIVEWLKGNVTCPLCRKDVEADTPQRRKERRIRGQLTTNFNNEDDMLDHVLNHSTDVFRPFRRVSEGPQITPLTDSYMPHDWAAPTYPERSSTRTATPDPGLFMPRRFPMSEIGGSQQRMHRMPMTQVRYGTVNINRNNNTGENTNNNTGETTINNTRDTRRSSSTDHSTSFDQNNADSEGTEGASSSAHLIGASGGHGNVSSSGDETELTSASYPGNRNGSAESTPPVLSSTASSSSVGVATPTAMTSLINRDSSVNSPGSIGSSGGSGGPERSRRTGTSGTGRTHPYVRPSSGSNE